MGQWVQVARENDLNNEEMRELTVAGRDILLARIHDVYYASDSRCPHLRGNLAKGKLDGTIVTCPLQGSQFDLVTGKVIRWTNCADPAHNSEKTLRPPTPLGVYKVKVEGGKVLVEI